MKTITLKELRQAPIAHTDTGDYLFVDGQVVQETIIPGIITKIRSGLFFLEIEGEHYTTHKQNEFEVGETVNCIIVPVIKEGNVEFIVRSVEKIIS